MSGEDSNTQDKPKRKRRVFEGETAEQLRAALSEPESERGRAALAALLDFVAVLVTVAPHGPALAAEVYRAASRAWKRNRKEYADFTLPGELEAHARHFHVALLCAVDEGHRKHTEYWRAVSPERRRREGAEARAALAYLARFTGGRAASDAEWPEYLPG